MSALRDDKDRQVLPRWRPWRTTLRLGELSPLGLKRETRPAESDALIEDKVREWENHRSVSYASDLVQTAFLTNERDRAQDAARFLLRNPDRVSFMLRDVAEELLQDAPAPTYSTIEEAILSPSARNIASLRLRLADAPRDAILRVDLARLYAVENAKAKAEREMIAAVQLAPDNRFVVRSAVRLFVHLDDYTRAYDVVRRSDATAADPWLMATEIAAASILGRRPVFAKKGLLVLRDQNFDPYVLSELAGALGTLEFAEGSRKKGKRLFGQALAAPNENVVAQAEWVARRKSELFVGDDVLHGTPLTFEAQAWEAAVNGNWPHAIEQAENWHKDQGFSSRPWELASYVANVGLADFGRGIRYCKRGLESSPTNFCLLNNLACAYAYAGRTEEAAETLRRISSSDLKREQLPYLHATTGLVHFRSGDLDRGRLEYEEAVTIARRISNKNTRARAEIALLQETLYAGLGEAEQLIAAAEKHAGIVKDPGVDAIVLRMRKHAASKTT